MKLLYDLTQRLRAFILDQRQKTSKKQNIRAKRLNINDFNEEEDFFLFI